MLSLLSNQIQSLNEQAHSFAFDVIFHPLKEKLQHVPNLQVTASVPHMKIQLVCFCPESRFGQV